MKAYATQDGFVYWGATDIEIVTKMRRAAFFSRFSSNRAFMREVLKRFRDRFNGRVPNERPEEEFVRLLVAEGVLVDVGNRFECPITHAFCEGRRESCEQECWMKTQRTT